MKPKKEMGAVSSETLRKNEPGRHFSWWFGERSTHQKVVPEYAPISKGNKTKRNKNKKTKPTLPAPPPNTQLIGSSNSSAVRKHRGSFSGLREGASKGIKSKPGLRNQQLGSPSVQVASPLSERELSPCKEEQGREGSASEAPFWGANLCANLPGSSVPCFWPLRPNGQGPVPSGD